MHPNTRVSLFVIPAPVPYEAYVYPVSAYPAPQQEIAAMGRLLQRIEGFEAKAHGNFETYLQVAQIHLGASARQLGENGREWLPEIGLGVWPNREPPSLYTDDEIRNIKEGESLRRLAFQVFRLGGLPEARLKAVGTMIGSGTLIHIRTGLSTAAFVARCEQTLKPPIREESFRAFPQFVPLLDSAALGNIDGATLETWLCGADLYLRESPEDGGILIVSNISLRRSIKMLDMELLSRGQTQESQARS